jgi:hypothetical protein
MPNIFREYPMDGITFYLGFIFLVILFLYFSGRYYLRENFDKNSYAKTEKMSDFDLPKTFMTNMPDRPYETQPIEKLDDYEYSLIFQNEGSREAGKREISDAMSRYPLSWTQRPPSDETFQSYREAFIDASEKSPPDLSSKQAFKEISGDAMIPPDQDAVDQEERKILAMYHPEKPQELKEYTLDNVIDLVKKVYDRKGLKADVERSKQGSNVFEIVDVQSKHPKIIWEDEVERDAPPVERYALRGEEQITIPQMATDIAAGLDPFFEPRTKVRMDRHDYTRWTPGLERQFAPTYNAKEWY